MRRVVPIGQLPVLAAVVFAQALVPHGPDDAQGSGARPWATANRFRLDRRGRWISLTVAGRRSPVLAGAAPAGGPAGPRPAVRADPPRRPKRSAPFDVERP